MADKARVIAIDGPSGAGKSSVSRIVGNRLGFLHVDRGIGQGAVVLHGVLLGFGQRESQPPRAILRKGAKSAQQERHKKTLLQNYISHYPNN